MSETPGESFQTTENRSASTAESVFIAGLLVHYAPDSAALAGMVDEHAEADAARTAAGDGADSPPITLTTPSDIAHSVPSRSGNRR